MLSRTGVMGVSRANESGRSHCRDCTFAEQGRGERSRGAHPVKRLDRSRTGAPPAPRCIPASLITANTLAELSYDLQLAPQVVDPATEPTTQRHNIR
jgi:hypothetical protein